MRIAPYIPPILGDFYRLAPPELGVGLLNRTVLQYLLNYRISFIIHELLHQSHLSGSSQQ